MFQESMMVELYWIVFIFHKKHIIVFNFFLCSCLGFCVLTLGNLLGMTYYDELRSHPFCNEAMCRVNHSKVNLIYKFTTSVRASVCLTRQFYILIHRQNRPGLHFLWQNRWQSERWHQQFCILGFRHWTQRKVTGKR